MTVVHALLAVAKWCALLVAMLLALSAAVLPLTEYGGILSYGIAGLAIVVGLAAVVLSFASRRSLLESAVAAVFLATAGLLFSINIVVAVSKANTAADVMAQAKAKEDEVRREREKGEAAQKAAEQMLKKAEEAPARAEAALKKAEEAEARAAEAPQQAAALLEQVKAEQAKLDKKRDQLATQMADLAAERAKVEDAKAKIEEQGKEAAAAKKAAADLATKADEDKRTAKKLLDDAQQKEKDAQELHKKVKEAIDGVKGNVKAKEPQDRKGAIAALRRLGDLAASADYELCQVIAFDPVPALRGDALDALEKVQPKLHPLVVTLTLPPERGKTRDGYKGAIKQLPDFGRAGLPLIDAQLQGKNPHLADWKIAHGVFDDLIEALSKIARDDKTALNLLLSLPDSPLAVGTKQNMLKDRVQGKKDVIESFDAQLRLKVGKHLTSLGNEKPETRKSIVPFLIALAQSALSVNIQ